MRYYILPNCLLLLLLLTNMISYSQDEKKQPAIDGFIIDSLLQKPVSFATITGLNNAKKQIVVTVSREDGSFHIKCDDKESITEILVSAVGYQTRTIQIEMEKQGTIKPVTLFLSASSNQLGEILIKTKLPLIKQQVDRLDYNLQSDPDSKVKSLLEMMKKMPYLSVDANDNVLFKGAGNFKILINGKPSAMLENNPKEVLKSIPASTIQRIEIITNPSSKYDAEGVSGIVNIVTIKKLSVGYNATVNLNGRSPAGGPGIGSSVSIKLGKLGISAFGGIYSGRNPNSNYQNSLQSEETQLSQTGYRSSRSGGGYFGSSFNYELDSLNLINFQFNGNLSRNRNRDWQTTELNSATGLLENYSVNTEGDSHGKGMDASINYQLGFKSDKTKFLVFSYRYMDYENTYNNTIGIMDKQVNTATQYDQSNDNGNREHTVQADWVQTVKKISFEAGAKGIFRKNESLFPSNSVGQVNTDEFLNKQDILGLYSTVRFAFKGWNLQTGLRAEKNFYEY